MSDISTEAAERRAKREARRVRQREQNFARAQAMRALRVAGSGPLSIPESSSCSLPGPHLHIGCSGWFYWGWRNVFYPPNLPTGRWFAHYAEQFQTVELNAPFYSWPTLANVKLWLRQAGDAPFLYTVKACELITHIKRFTDTKTLIRDFGLIADILGPRMGCFLFQLPPSYRYTPARLKAIVGQLDCSRRNVVEFRHPSWWNEDVYRAFRKHGIIFCSCSAPKLPDMLVRTADDIYVRFHGTKRWYRHDYSFEELRAWAERIRACGAKHVWIYFNNDFDGYAPKNARELQNLLKVSQLD